MLRLGSLIYNFFCYCLSSLSIYFIFYYFNLGSNWPKDKKNKSVLQWLYVFNNPNLSIDQNKIIDEDLDYLFR